LWALSPLDPAVLLPTAVILLLAGVSLEALTLVVGSAGVLGGTVSLASLNLTVPLRLETGISVGLGAGRGHRGRPGPARRGLGLM
jgi:hypothetical protein